MSGEKMPSEKRLQRRLKYFFMNPCEKWKAKKKFPWKLILQIIKIIFVTFQVLSDDESLAFCRNLIIQKTCIYNVLFLELFSSNECQ